nr:MAG TPA: hypothetical protein [Caudoviricetes sp.]
MLPAIGFTIGEALKIGMQWKAGLKKQQMLKDQYIAQVNTHLKNFNYNVQALQAKRQDVYEQIVGEIEKVRMNQAKLKSSVVADLNEQYAGGGRTADLIERDMDAAEGRAVFSLQDLFRKQSHEINQNIETAQITRDSAVKGIPKPDHKAIMWENLIQTFQSITNIMGRNQQLSDAGGKIDIFGRVVSSGSNSPANTFSGYGHGNSVFGGNSFTQGFGTYGGVNSFGSNNYFGFNNYHL